MKAIKIVDELISLYFNIGITDLHIDLQYTEKNIIVTLEGDCENPPLEKLDSLQEVLNTPRQEELDEYYWELVGENDQYQELTLLGALVDRGKIDYKDNRLKIIVYRNIEKDDLVLI